MVDTIRIRLYGILDLKPDVLAELKAQNQNVSKLLVPEHYELYQKLLNYKGKNFTMKVAYNREKKSLEDLTEEEYLIHEHSKAKNAFVQQRNMMRFVNDQGVKDVKLAISGDYRVSSSTSDVRWWINENAGFLDFEFSVPKYLYGHNLAQFVPQINSDTSFNLGFKIHEWTTQVKLAYDRLFNFIENRFFVDLCKHFEIDMLPNMRYIEMRRIDLCYNQFFETKEQALAYQDQQKKLKKEKSYKTRKETTNYGTTYALSTSFGSYFKIYHKGTEYSNTKQGDLKKHMEVNKNFINRNWNKKIKAVLTKEEMKIFKDNKMLLLSVFDQMAKGSPLVLHKEKKDEIRSVATKLKSILSYDVVWLKKQMDKVLRYEVTLYGDFFKYAYKQKAFRRNCPVHNHFKKIYKTVKSDMQSLNPNKRRLTKEDFRDYKMFHTWSERKVHLMMCKMPLNTQSNGKWDYDKETGVYKVNSIFYKKTVLADKDVGEFSEYFLKLCFKHFKNLIEKHQINQLLKFDDLAQKIKHYNTRVEEKKDEYNRLNNNECFFITPRGERKRKQKKNGQFVMKATQLLTQTELREKKLKKVNANVLLMLLKQLEDGFSLQQYRQKAGIGKSTFYRYKKDLEMFGIFESSLEMTEPINVRTDFKDYYWLTDMLDYQNKMFINPKLVNYESPESIRNDRKTAHKIAFTAFKKRFYLY